MMEPAIKRKIFLIDDCPVLREAFARLLNEEADLSVCGQASSATLAVNLLAQLEPNLLIVDISADEGQCMDSIHTLVAAYPQAPILIFSMCDEMAYAERAIRAGAKGFVLKKAPREELLHAIRQVLAKEIYLSSQVQSLMLKKVLTGSNDSPVARLSDRQLQVFELIGRGFKTGEIAKKLNLSIKTIETYQAQIKEKLSLRNSTQLAGHAARWVSLSQHSVE